MNGLGARLWLVGQEHAWSSWSRTWWWRGCWDEVFGNRMHGVAMGQLCTCRMAHHAENGSWWEF